jgi:hypothetical protein
MAAKYSVALVSAGRQQGVSPRRTFACSALGAAQPFDDGGEIAIPSRKGGEGFGVAPARMAALTGKQYLVLPEMIV